MPAELTQAEKDYQLSRPNEVATNGMATFRIAGLVICEIAVALRFWGRKVQKMKLRADDWCLLVAAILLIGHVVTGLLTQKWGYGHHSLNVPKKTMPQKAKAAYAYNLFYTTTFPISRISLVLLYMRIFVKRWFIYVCWFMVFAYASYSFSTVIIDAFGVLPINANWNKSVKPTRTIDSVKLVRANCIFNILSDLILLILPLCIIWRLQMRKLTKLGVSAIFCLGALTLVASIMRFYYNLTSDPKDPDFSGVPGSWWTYAETFLGILCPCLVTFQPVLIFIYRAFLARLSRVNRGRVSRFTGIDENISYNATRRDKNGRIIQSDEDIRITAKEVGPSLSSKASDLEAQKGSSVTHTEVPRLPTSTISRSRSMEKEKPADGNTAHLRGEDGMAFDQDAAVARLDPRTTTGNGVVSSNAEAVGEGKRGEPEHQGIGVKKEWELASEKA